MKWINRRLLAMMLVVAMLLAQVLPTVALASDLGGEELTEEFDHAQSPTYTGTVRTVDGADLEILNVPANENVTVGEVRDELQSVYSGMSFLFGSGNDAVIQSDFSVTAFGNGVAASLDPFVTAYTVKAGEDNDHLVDLKSSAEDFTLSSSESYATQVHVDTLSGTAASELTSGQLYSLQLPHGLFGVAGGRDTFPEGATGNAIHGEAWIEAGVLYVTFTDFGVQFCLESQSFYFEYGCWQRLDMTWVRENWEENYTFTTTIDKKDIVITVDTTGIAPDVGHKIGKWDRDKELIHWAIPLSPGYADLERLSPKATTVYLQDVLQIDPDNPEVSAQINMALLEKDFYFSTDSHGGDRIDSIPLRKISADVDGFVVEIGPFSQEIYLHFYTKPKVGFEEYVTQYTDKYWFRFVNTARIFSDEECEALIDWTTDDFNAEICILEKALGAAVYSEWLKKDVLWWYISIFNAWDTFSDRLSFSTDKAVYLTDTIPSQLELYSVDIDGGEDILEKSQFVDNGMPNRGYYTLDKTTNVLQICFPHGLKVDDEIRVLGINIATTVKDGIEGPLKVENKIVMTLDPNEDDGPTGIGNGPIGASIRKEADKDSYSFDTDKFSWSIYLNAGATGIQNAVVEDWLDYGVDGSGTLVPDVQYQEFTVGDFGYQVFKRDNQNEPIVQGNFTDDMITTVDGRSVATFNLSEMIGVADEDGVVKGSWVIRVYAKYVNKDFTWRSTWASNATRLIYGPNHEKVEVDDAGVLLPNTQLQKYALDRDGDAVKKYFPDLEYDEVAWYILIDQPKVSNAGNTARIFDKVGSNQKLSEKENHFVVRNIDTESTNPNSTIQGWNKSVQNWPAGFWNDNEQIDQNQGNFQYDRDAGTFSADITNYTGVMEIFYVTKLRPGAFDVGGGKVVVENTATYSYPGTSHPDLTAHVTEDLAVEKVSKSGTIEPGVATWKITMNPKEAPLKSLFDVDDHGNKTYYDVNGTVKLYDDLPYGVYIADIMKDVKLLNSDGVPIQIIDRAFYDISGKPDQQGLYLSFPAKALDGKRLTLEIRTVVWKTIAAKNHHNENVVYVEINTTFFGWKDSPNYSLDAGTNADSSGIKKIIIKKVDENGEPLPGVVLSLYDTVERRYIGDSQTVPADGIVSWVVEHSGMPRYMLVENSTVPGYKQWTGNEYGLVYEYMQRFAPQATAYEVVNESIYGSVQFYKVDDVDVTKGLPGATFTLKEVLNAAVYPPVYSDTIKTAQSGENGVVKFTELELDQLYVIQEQSAPQNYNANPEAVLFVKVREVAGKKTVDWMKTIGGSLVTYMPSLTITYRDASSSELVWKNSQGTYFSFTKYDVTGYEKDKEPPTKLSGAQYKLYATSGGVKTGQPLKFKLQNGVYYYRAEYQGLNSGVDSVLVGAGEDSDVTIDGLPIGLQFVLEESTAPDGYVGGVELKITANERYGFTIMGRMGVDYGLPSKGKTSFYVLNAPIPVEPTANHIFFRKTTTDDKLLKDVSFTLLKDGTDIGTYATDDDGNILICFNSTGALCDQHGENSDGWNVAAEQFNPDAVYTLVENEAVKGYRDVTGTASNALVPCALDADPIIWNEFENVRVLGEFQLKKVGEGSADVLGGAVFTLGTTQENFRFIKESEAVYRAIVADAHYTNAPTDGSEIVTELTTVAGGPITIKGLPVSADTYVLTETKAPNGYKLDETEHAWDVIVTDVGGGASVNGVADAQVSVDVAGTSASWAVPLLTIKNTKTPVTGGFELTKIDRLNGNLIEGAVFELWNVTVGGDTVTKVDIVDIDEATLTTDEEGEIAVNGLPVGLYGLYETAAPDPYAAVNAAGELKAVITVTYYMAVGALEAVAQVNITGIEDVTGTADLNTASAKLTVANDLHTGDVELDKADSLGDSAGIKLVGAKFALVRTANAERTELTTSKPVKLNLNATTGKYEYAGLDVASKIISNASGHISLVGLPCGTYALTESDTDALEGYKAEAKTWTIVIDQAGFTINGAATGVIYNDRQTNGSIAITKTGLDDVSVKVDAAFELTNLTDGWKVYRNAGAYYVMAPAAEPAAGYTEVTDGIMDTVEGQLAINWLPVGDWILTEVSADGYLNPRTPWTIRVDAQGVATLADGADELTDRDKKTIFNKKPTGAFTLEKRDTASNDLIAGAKFELRDDSDAVVNFTVSGNTYIHAPVAVQGVTTVELASAEAALSVQGLPSSVDGLEYKLYETKAPEDYVDYGKVLKATITVASEADGEFSKAVAAIVTADDTASHTDALITVKNTKHPSGDLTVKKVDAFYNASPFSAEVMVPGAKFKLYDHKGDIVKFTSAIDNEYTYDEDDTIDEITTDATGTFTLKGLPLYIAGSSEEIGVYTLTETGVPTGYTGSYQRKIRLTEGANGAVIVEYWNGSDYSVMATPIVVTNERSVAKLVVTKNGVDQDVMSGVKFTVLCGAVQLSFARETASGKYVYLPNGVTVPDGWTRETTLVTDVQGKVTIERLPVVTAPEPYALVETETLAGYKLPTGGAEETTVSLNAGDNSVSIGNARKTRPFSLVKYDATAAAKVALPNVTFTLAPATGHDHAVVTNPQQATGQDGTITWTDLMYGETYTLTETKPDGYDALVAAGDASWTVAVGLNGALTITSAVAEANYAFSNGDPLSFTNPLRIDNRKTAVAGEIQLLKRDGVTESPVGDTKFQLKPIGADNTAGAPAAFGGSDGEYTYSTGALTTLTNAADGTLWLKGIPEGKYALVESEPNPGYLLQDGGLTLGIVEIKWSVDAVTHQAVPESTWTGLAAGVTAGLPMIVDNEHRLGGFRICKVDKDGDQAGTKRALEGAQFELKDQRGAAIMGFRMVEGAETPVDTTDANGFLSYKNLRQGSYTLTELTPPAGFELDQPRSWTLVIGEDGKASLSGTPGDYVALSPDKETLTVYNDALTTTFDLFKYDADTNRAMGLVEFELDGDLVKGNDAVRVTSNVEGTDKGWAHWAGLKYGRTYTLTEVSAPDHYNRLDGASWTIKVSMDGGLAITPNGSAPVPFETIENTLNLTTGLKVCNVIKAVDFDLVKMDLETGAPLAATFELRGDFLASAVTDQSEGAWKVYGPNDEAITVLTNGQGVAEWPAALKLGETYTLTETVAPNGYRKLPDDAKWLIEVLKTEGHLGELSITSTLSEKAGGDDDLYDYELLNNGNGYTVDFTQALKVCNKPVLADFDLIKYDKDTEMTMDGVTFSLTGDFADDYIDANGDEVATPGLTGAGVGQEIDQTTVNGIAAWPKALKQGHVYYLREKTGKTGYKELADKAWKITVGTDANSTLMIEGISEATGVYAPTLGTDYTLDVTQDLKIYNVPKTERFGLEKIDKDTNAVMNATFRLTGDFANTVVATGETVEFIQKATAGGKAEWSNLKWGVEYILTEVTPDGYKELQNASWILEYPTEGVNKGKLTITGNHVTERSSDPDEPYDYELKVNDQGYTALDLTEALRIYNVPQTAKFQLFKYDSDTELPLDGVEFTLTGEDCTLADGELNAKTTDKDGWITWTGLKYGKVYKLRETWVQDKYAVLSGAAWTITVGLNGGLTIAGDANVPAFETDKSGVVQPDGSTLNLTNILKVCNVPHAKPYGLLKFDEDTGLALKDVTFTLTGDFLNLDSEGNATAGLITKTENGQTVEYISRTTNADGEAHWPAALKHGQRYELTEIPKAGYLPLVGQSWTVDVGDNGVVTLFSNVTQSGVTSSMPLNLTGLLKIWNVQKKGEFSFTKKDQFGTLMSGVTFTLKSSDARDDEGNLLVYTAQSDADANVVFSNIRTGTYTMTETPKSGYKTPPAWTVELMYDSASDAVKLETTAFANGGAIVNEQIVGKLELRKLDQFGTKVEGAVFRLTAVRTEDGSTPRFTDCTTLADGLVTFQNLVAGEYGLREVSAPAHYQAQPEKTWKVTATLDAAASAMAVSVLDGTEKVTEIVNTQALGALEFEKTDQLDAKVDGAEFQLEGTALDGTGYKKTARSENGRVRFADIKVNDPEKPYILTELSAPAGYVRLDTQWTVHAAWSTADKRVAVTITDPADRTKTVESIENKRVLGNFEIEKRGNEAATPLLDGAEFTLYKADGTTKIATNALGETLTNPVTTANGRATFEGLDEGEYVLKETKTPDGYHLRGSGSWTIAVDKLGAVTANANMTNQVLNVTNNRNELGELLLKKVAATSKAALIGATFQLSGTNYTKTQTTAANGTAKFSEIPVGTYTLSETAAPAGYQKLATTWTVIVAQNGTTTINGTNVRTVAYEIENQEVASADYEVLKVSAGTGAVLAGATFQLTGGTPAIAQTMTTGSDGIAVFTGLKPGSYTMTETKAPTGHVLAKSAWTITVDAEGAVTGTGMIAGRITVTNAAASGAATFVPGGGGSATPPGVGGVTLGDNATPLSAGLPGTGDTRNRTLAALMLAASLAGAATCVAVGRRRKKRNGR